MGVWVAGLPPLSLMGSTWMPSLGPRDGQSLWGGSAIQDLGVPLIPGRIFLAALGSSWLPPAKKAGAEGVSELVLPVIP